MKKVYILIFFLIAGSLAHGQNEFDMNASTLDNPEAGYLFLAPLNPRTLYILDNLGQTVFKKDYDHQVEFINFSVQDNNTKLTFMDAMRNQYMVLDKNLNEIDSFSVPSPYFTDFHDFKLLPNGHALMLGYETRVINMSLYVDGGDSNANVIGSVVMELDQNKNAVFVWSSFDHYAFTDATADIDLTQQTIDLTHANTVEMDNDGNILLSTRDFDEITKISRLDGSIIWRMGGSASRNNQFRFTNDTINGFYGFSHQHGCYRLQNGHILLFDNGNMRTNMFSRAVEYAVDEVNHTATKVWEYRHSPDIFTQAMGYAQRLPNGNTLIGWGNNNDQIVVTEVRPDGSKAYELVSSDKAINSYRAFRFPFNMAAVTQTVNTNGSYIYNQNDNNTGVTINVTSVSTAGKVTVEKHDYAARNQQFSQAPKIIYPYRWMITKPVNSTAISGTVIFDVSNTSISEPANVKVYYRNHEGSGQFSLLSATLNDQTNEIAIPFPGFGEYIMSTNILPAPVLSKPANNSLGVSDNVKLSWMPTPSANWYDIQVSLMSDFSQLMISDTITTPTGFTCDGLNGNTTYYWRVRARKDTITSNWSKTWSFSTLITPPKLYQPENHFKGAQTDSVFFAWEDVPNVDTYRLQIAEDSLFMDIFTDKIDLKTSHISVQNFKSNKIYYWRVNSKNAGGTSEWSEFWSFDTKLYPPKTIFPVDKSAGIPLSGVIRWKSLIGATSYRIQIADNSIFLNPIQDETGILDTTRNYQNLDHNKLYYWRVKASINLDKTEWSDASTFTTILDAPVQSYPIDNAEDQNLNGYLGWKQVKGAKFYTVQISKDSAFTQIIQEKDSIIPAKYIYFNLFYNSIYYWRVAAIDTAGANGDWSLIWKFNTHGNKGLPEPTILSPENESKGIPLPVVFLWSKEKNAVNYNLQIAKDPYFDTLLVSETLSDTSFANIQLEHFNEYYWRVSASYQGDMSDWSATSQFRTIMSAPILLNPKDSATEMATNGILMWNNVIGAQSYEIQISLNSDMQQIINQDSISTVSNYSYTDLLPQTRYFWRTRGLNEKEKGEWSNIYTFVTTLKTLVEEKNHLTYIKIYPNPFTNVTEAEIESDNENSFELKIFDLKGSLVFSLPPRFIEPGLNKIPLNLEGLNNGDYIYQIIIGNEVKSGMLIILK